MILALYKFTYLLTYLLTFRPIFDYLKLGLFLTTRPNGKSFLTPDIILLRQRHVIFTAEFLPNFSAHSKPAVTTHERRQGLIISKTSPVCKVIVVFLVIGYLKKSFKPRFSNN